MNAKYTLKSGIVLNVFLWNDVLTDKPFHTSVDVWVKGQGEVSIPLHIDYNGSFIKYAGEKVYLKDYDYMPIDTLIEKLDTVVKTKDCWLVSDDEILATFLRETDKIGIVAEMPVYDFLVPIMGIGICGSERAKVLTVPTERHYKKSDWFYKLSLEVVDVRLKGKVASEDYYFSDFCSAVKSGRFKIVNKEKYIAENSVNVCGTVVANA